MCVTVVAMAVTSVFQSGSANQRGEKQFHSGCVGSAGASSWREAVVQPDDWTAGSLHGDDRRGGSRARRWLLTGHTDRPAGDPEITCPVSTQLRLANLVELTGNVALGYSLPRRRPLHRRRHGPRLHQEGPRNHHRRVPLPPLSIPSAKQEYQIKVTLRDEGGDVVVGGDGFGR